MALSQIMGYLTFIDKHSIPLGVVPMARGQQRSRNFHRHNFSELALILSGSARHEVGSFSRELKPGDLLLLHPGIVHGYENTADVELINLLYVRDKISIPVLDAEMLPLIHKLFFPEGERQSEEEAVRPIMTLDGEELARTAAEMLALRREIVDMRPGYQMGALSMFMALVLRLARIYGAGPRRHAVKEYSVDKALQFIHAHYAEPFDVDTVVRLSHMSRRNFFRAFRNATGTTPREYVMLIRLRNAIDLLQSSERNVSEIAVGCGFYDGNHLCRLFRERFGTTPRKFRRSKQSVTLAPVTIRVEN